MISKSLQGSNTLIPCKVLANTIAGCGLNEILGVPRNGDRRADHPGQVGQLVEDGPALALSVGGPIDQVVANLDQPVSPRGRGPEERATDADFSELHCL
ncbi:hypothetical protein ACFWBB_41700 [Streptomyces sp. NPDC060000]|uniref:hypothetical protein n=1 Tax=Streptomyces sp. NPDC060000 TaxID=3347031 RepID=UPI0036806F0F